MTNKYSFADFYPHFIVYEHSTYSSWCIRLALNLVTFEPRVRGGGLIREHESCSQVQSMEITIKYEYFMPGMVELSDVC